MLRKVLDFGFLIAILIVGFIYRDRLQEIYQTAYYHYFPCRSPITYSIGEFDTRFGLSKADFIDSLSQGEKIWEGAINKQLFKYDPNGLLKINLIYDNRQATTQQLKNMGLEVNSSKSSYDELKKKYDSLNAEYLSLKRDFEAKVSDFEARKNAYEVKVNSVNARGGGTKAVVASLNDERDSINSELQAVQAMQTQLNTKVDQINAVASALNDTAKSLNLTVDRYNSVGGSLGGEFEEGTYTQEGSKRRIDVYQFENKTKLVRVLAHELGHALGLEHNDDPKAIMYRLNNGVNEKLTQEDISEVKSLCGIK